MKVTGVPAHTGLAEAATVTLTGNIGLTTIVTVLEVAGLPLLHVSLDVITTDIASLLAGEYVYVALLVPTGVAPLYH